VTGETPLTQSACLDTRPWLGAIADARHAGRHRHRQARSAAALARTSIAHCIGVERYRRRSCSISPWSSERACRIEGRLVADIVQECIVTLDPLPSHISESVSGVFLPEDSKLGREGFGQGGEILIEVDGPDSPETFSGDSIDVGALAEEFFALSIDPYPRKADAALDKIAPGLVAEPEEGELQKKLKSLLNKS
jgi:hypothetical protein